MGMPTHILRRLSYSISAIIAGVLVPATGFAQIVGGGTLPVDKTYETISAYTLMIAQFLNIMTWFVFSFLIFLLDPRFIFDMPPEGEGSLMEVLNLIWRLSRDLMNVGFAVGLVGAAIYTVVTANKEFVSAHLKTFVMAVILVNFSWFIPRVALDIANVTAATIYSIPTAITNPAAKCTYTSTKEEGCIKDGAALADGSLVCKCKAVADFMPFPGTKKSAALKAADKTWECYWAYCIRFVELNKDTATQHGGILNGLIVNHARLPMLAVVTRTDVDDDIADLLLFVLRELVVIVIHIAILFPLIALLLALVIRIPILWLTMAFMPFYFLSWVIPDEIAGLGAVKEKAKVIWDWFLKAAFLPAAVAIPLSIGYLMANAGTRVTFAGIRDIPFNLIDGMGNFGQLLWVIMVLGILWSGTFMVLELMTADMPGGNLISSIKNTGEQAGKFAAELPLSTVPLPGVGGNLLNFSKMFSAQGISNMRNAAARGGPAAAFGFGPSGTGGVQDADRLKTFTGKMSEDEKKDKAEKLSTAVDEFAKAVDRNPNNVDLNVIFKDALQGSNVTLDNKSFQTHIDQLLKDLKVDQGKINAFNTKATAFTNRGAAAQPPVPGGPPAGP